ncbi:MAG: class Ia ribonucleoside-diphosphate reductase subunit beta [Candidatus Nitrosotenuis sp.]
MKTVYNKDIVDFTRQPLFFGADLNMQRYDVFRYPVLDKLNEKMQGLYWRPVEISLQKDRSDYQSFRPEQKFIFTKNLSYQILLDSVQGRGPETILQTYCSNPELEGCIITWGFFEAIHSRAYTHIIKNVYPDASVIFDDVMKDQYIQKRAQSVTKYYDDFLLNARAYEINDSIGNRERAKRALVKLIYNINALEGLRFYSSFAVTFAFGELKVMEGSAKNISLIARDEIQHLALTQHIIKIWQKGDDPEILEILNEPGFTEEMRQMYADILIEEKEWNIYMFSEGSIIGCNERLHNDYLDFISGRRLKAIGLEPIEKQTQNPYPWTDHWLSSSGLQEAPMETEKQSYLIGAIKADIDYNSFSNFSL